MVGENNPRNPYRDGRQTEDTTVSTQSSSAGVDLGVLLNSMTKAFCDANLNTYRQALGNYIDFATIDASKARPQVRKFAEANFTKLITKKLRFAHTSANPINQKIEKTLIEIPVGALISPHLIMIKAAKVTLGLKLSGFEQKTAKSNAYTKQSVGEVLFNGQLPDGFGNETSIIVTADSNAANSDADVPISETGIRARIELELEEIVPPPALRNFIKQASDQMHIWSDIPDVDENAGKQVDDGPVSAAGKPDELPNDY